MSQIFVSYASEDRERAKALAEVLERHGFSIWWDRKIPFGKAFDEVIAESLADAACVLVLWSSVSVESRWVRSEASEAANRELLLPVLMEPDVKIPLEFRLLQAANLSDWNGDPDYPEFKALLAQIETMLVPAATGAQQQGAVARPDARDAAVAERERRQRDLGKAAAAGSFKTNDNIASKGKLGHLLVFILLPTLAISIAAALAMSWRLPTRIQLDLVVDRVMFTLAGNQPVDLPAAPLGFTMFSIENFDRAIFTPKRLRVKRDGRAASASGAAGWREVPARGEVVLSGAPDERTLLVLEQPSGAARPSAAGRLQPVAAKPGARVTLHARSGASPRFVLRMDGQALQTNALTDGEVELTASHATVEDGNAAANGTSDIMMQVALADDNPYVQLHGERRFFVVTAALDAAAPIALLNRADVQDIELTRQGAGGAVESAIVAAGEVSYPGHTDIERKVLAPGDFVGVSELTGAALTRLELRPDHAGMDLRLDGVAGKAQMSSGGMVQDLRLTAFDLLWHNAQAAVLLSIAVWALSVAAGAYRLYKDFAPA